MVVRVAIAILSQDGQVLMQLRDNIPNIIYPGYWGFFGGHLEPGETPMEALKREIQEEINYAVPAAKLFGIYSDSRHGQPQIQRYVFHVPLTAKVTTLELNEGWDMALLPLRSIRNGGEYSSVAGQWRPIAPIHQRILFDFF